jgi:hypothetical protein
MKPVIPASIALSFRRFSRTARRTRPLGPLLQAGLSGVLMALAACAAAPPQQTSSAAEPPLRLFHDADIAQVAQVLQRTCMAAGMKVVEQPPHRLVCVAQLDGEQAILARRWMRNTADRLPVRKTEFVLTPAGANVRVDGTQWIETYTDDGQTLHNRLNLPSQIERLRSFVDSAR